MHGRSHTLEAQAVGLFNQDQIVETRKELNKPYAIEEDMWHKRSQSNWVKSGDKTLDFFMRKHPAGDRRIVSLG